VKLAVESVPELEKYFDGELKRMQEFEKGHLLENPRKPKDEKQDFIDDNDFDFFSKISKLRRDEIKAAADSEGSGKTQDLGIELDFTEEEQDGEQGLPSNLILNDLISREPNAEQNQFISDNYNSKRDDSSDEEDFNERDMFSPFIDGDDQPGSSSPEKDAY
jgi:hypothetical protein